MKSWISNKPLTPEKEDSSEWNSTTDTISLKVRSDLLKLSAKNRGNQTNEENVPTKHSEDLRPHPIGLPAALTIHAKIGMQEL